MLRAVRSAPAETVPTKAFGLAGLSLGTGCWLLLWTGINTGPWNLDFDYTFGSWIGTFNGVRAAFPLAILVAAGVYLLTFERVSPRRFTVTEKLWGYYALVCLASGTYADPWFASAYWGFAFLAALAAAGVFMREGRDPLQRAIELNRLGWIIASVMLVMMLWVARGKLFVSGSTGLTGYNLVNRMPTTWGMPTSRASGMSRFAAVPAIVAMAWFWRCRGPARLLCAAVLAGAFTIVWLMQSRGSLIGTLAALPLVMILLGGRAARVGAVVLILAAMVYAAGFVPNDTIHHLYLYAARGAQGQALRSMSDRVSIYRRTIPTIERAPFFGYGWRADRLVLGTDGQNGFLYALLCGGFIGGAGYIGGLILTWWMLLRIVPYRRQLKPEHRIMLVQAAGLLTFFTVRSYPENAAALYSVDLMLLLPAVVFIGELDRALRRAKVTRQVRSVTAPRPSIPNARVA